MRFVNNSIVSPANSKILQTSVDKKLSTGNIRGTSNNQKASNVSKAPI